MPIELIEIDHWTADEDFSIHPVGSKPKRMIRAPNAVTTRGVIPEHAYLFKTADGWRAQQMWSEYIASRIGELLRLPVPKCFIGFHRGRSEYGVLMEFFYGYPGDASPPRLVHGADVLNLVGKQKGDDRPHSARTNIRVCQALFRVQEAPNWWARTLAFDALIGNTDRHSENWGLLVSQGRYDMAPIYDNGTSLGYIIRDASLREYNTEAGVGKVLRRGTHHCGWVDQDGGSINHFELCRVLHQHYPGTKDAIEAILQLRIDDLSGILSECVALDVEPRFTAEREQWVSSQTAARLSRLRETVGA